MDRSAFLLPHCARQPWSLPELVLPTHRKSLNVWFVHFLREAGRSLADKLQTPAQISSLLLSEPLHRDLSVYAVRASNRLVSKPGRE